MAQNIIAINLAEMKINNIEILKLPAFLSP